MTFLSRYSTFQEKSSHFQYVAQQLHPYLRWLLYGTTQLQWFLDIRMTLISYWPQRSKWVLNKTEVPASWPTSIQVSLLYAPSICRSSFSLTQQIQLHWILLDDASCSPSILWHLSDLGYHIQWGIVRSCLDQRHQVSDPEAPNDGGRVETLGEGTVQGQSLWARWRVLWMYYPSDLLVQSMR